VVLLEPKLARRAAAFDKIIDPAPSFEKNPPTISG
jgi:hypothetical protein